VRTTLTALGATLVLGASLAVAAPASASTDELLAHKQSLSRSGTAAPVESSTVSHVGANPGQLGISGCFMKTAPIFVTSGLDSIKVWDVSDPASPVVTGTLPNAVFENEAMNCGERRTKNGTKRFALIGVDLYQATPTDPQHQNVGGNELIVVDVTDPSAPTIRSRTDASTSTHTVACVDERDCNYAYSAGGSGGFSVFDLRRLNHPREVDGDRAKDGLQPHQSPTPGHKWNFDAAGVGTHTGDDGASMWSTDRPARPRLITTTGRAGRGEHPDYPGWNDFILHNAFRPNATAFKPNAKPALRNGNVLLVTEEDYEQTDCTQAGSFQTWWVKRLDGSKSAIVPLDKVELSDLGNYPLPQGGFCSAHWFDYRQGGLVAAGFYGGGTQILDVRDPRKIKSYGHSLWGGSEVWDAMWVPVYKDGVQTRKRTNIVYSIDLVRGLDVYEVQLPGTAERNAGDGDAAPMSGGVVPLGVAGGAIAVAAAIGRLRRRRD
jgi:LVIVD repeat